MRKKCERKRKSERERTTCRVLERQRSKKKRKKEAEKQTDRKKEKKGRMGACQTDVMQIVGSILSPNPPLPLSMNRGESFFVPLEPEREREVERGVE